MTDTAITGEALLRHLPAVDKLKRHALLQDLDVPPSVLATLCREVIAEVRAGIQAGSCADPVAIEAAVTAGLQERRSLALGPSLRRIINGTGVLLHTNAGRAPLPQSAVQAIADSAGGYCNLEFSLLTGGRSSRQDHVRPLLRWLTGAEDALVVNNGAAAVLLALHGLAHGREVVVSRGELVEIGGGFRIPEVMTAAGCTLREVGTTNRTHVRDYQRVLKTGHKIAGLLQVHRSNFAVVGFTATPDLADLAALAHQHDLPLIVDLGSGALGPLPAQLIGMNGEPPRHEPTVQEVLAAGADLVCFSGDKLLGAPQAGILAGNARLIHKLAANPMARALRVDNLTLAGLEAVLRTHLRGRAEQELPAVRALAMPAEAVAELAETWASALRSGLDGGWQVAVVPSQARPGGGVDPLLRVPSHCLALRREGVTGPTLARRLRLGPVAVLGRVRGDQVLLDVRTLLAGGEDRVQADLATALAAI